jgi:hypothetical protein
VVEKSPFKKQKNEVAAVAETEAVAVVETEAVAVVVAAAVVAAEIGADFESGLTPNC